MKPSSITINKENSKLFLLLFPFIKPSEQALIVVFGKMGALISNIYIMWSLLSIGWIFILFITNYGKDRSTKHDSHSIIAILLGICLLLSTLLNGNYSITYVLRVVGAIVAIILLCEVYNGEKAIQLLRVSYHYLTLIAVLSSISIFYYYPNGMYLSGTNSNYYLFGLDNVSFMYAFHGFSLGVILQYFDNKKISGRFIALYAFILLAYVYCETGTGTSIIVLSMVYLLLINNKIVRKINYSISIICCLTLFVFFVVMQNFSIFNDLLFLLKKDSGMTLNGRIYIWNAALHALPRHWILGYGIMDSITQQALIEGGLNWSVGSVGHLHNILLEFLFKGGVVGLALFALLVLSGYKRMMNNEKSIIANIVSCLFLLSWITCTFEFRLNTYSFWFIFFAVFNIDDLCGKNSRTAIESE